MNYLCSKDNLNWSGRSGRDHMVVGFITTYAISAYYHWRCEFESRSGEVTFNRSMGLSWYSGFLHKKKKKTWPPRYSWNIVESGVKHGWVPAVRLKYDQSWNIIIRHPRFFTIVYIYIYISYKTTFFQKYILKLSLGRYLWNVFQDTQNSLNWICLSDSNFCVHGLCFLVI